MLSIEVQIGLVLLLIFLVQVFTNLPISIALGASSLITMMVFGMDIGMYADLMVSGMRQFSYLAIPFFILAGALMEHSGVAARIIRFAKACMGATTGGLAIMAVAVNIFWGAVSGAGPATVAALGRILINSMSDDGYDRSFSAALVAASGGISIIVPPSLAYIVYGVIAGVSIGDLFIAGIIPGILMGLMFAIYAYFYSKKYVLKCGVITSKHELWVSFKEAFLALLTPLIILGGIYGGIFTPTEAAAVAVFYSLILALIVYKTISIKELFKIFAESGKVSASIMIIIGNATVLSYLLTIKGVAKVTSTALTSASSSNITILFIMMIILLIAGCFINGSSILYIFVPIMLPIIKNMGYDPLWFGIFITMVSGVGMITPPVAINLYPAASIANISLSSISKAILPFVGVAIIVSIIITFVPQLSLWLPNLIR